MKFPLALVLLATFAAVDASADDGAAPPPRPVVKKPIEPPKFENGKLTDSYWGVAFELPGLEEKKIERQAGRLLDAHVGRVQVEVSVWEYPDELSAKDRRDGAKKLWDEKHRIVEDYAQGDDPAPWATFVGEAPSGDKRREGYAFFARGPRAFVVHAFAVAELEGGAAAVKSALGGLTVGPETGACVQAQVVSKQNGMALDDPGVLADAAARYLPSPDDKFAVALPAIAEDLLLRAIAGIPGTRIERKTEVVMRIHQNLAGAQMRQKKYDAALATLQKCVDMAAKTDAPGPDGAAIQYDLACLYSLQGKLDDAFATLDKAFARAADWGPPVPDDHLKKDPDLENCRKDPRWAKFLETKPTKK